LKIDIRSKDCCYIELNEYIYYIDDSTNEQIIQKFKKCGKWIEEIEN
tara:strand:- start:183 stop:323 length:141 start_codon:yes stop_codon:yes gene_type:complete